MASQRRRAGFTLLELFAVVGILVVLAAILIPVIGMLSGRANRAKSLNRLNSLCQAVEIYLGDWPLLGDVHSATLTDSGFIREPYQYLHVRMKEMGREPLVDFPVKALRRGSVTLPMPVSDPADATLIVDAFNQPYQWRIVNVGTTGQDMRYTETIRIGTTNGTTDPADDLVKELRSDGERWVTLRWDPKGQEFIAP